MLGMKAVPRILLSTGSVFHLPLPEVFRAAKESGFDGVELLLGPELAGVTGEEFALLSSRWEVPVAAIHAPCIDLVAGNEDLLQRVAPVTAMAARLGAGLVSIHPMGLVRQEENVRAWVKGAGTILVSVENMPCGVSPINEAEALLLQDAWALNEFAGRNGLRVTYDVTHLAARRGDVLSGYGVFKPNLVNIHLSDYIAGYQHLLPGRGELPLGRLLRGVDREGGPAYVTLEVSPEAFSRKGFEFVVRDLAAAREWMGKHLPA